MTKTRVDVEDVFQNSDEQHRWNFPKLSQIEFYRDGKPVEVPEKLIEEWEFIGLSNDKFILDYDWPD